MRTISRAITALTLALALALGTTVPASAAAEQAAPQLGASDAVSDIYYQVLLKHTVWVEQQWSPAINAYALADFRFAVVLGNAVLLSEPDRYDASVAGIDQATLVDHTVKTITRYAATNRLTGGTEWGKQLFWDTTYESYFVLAARLLWDRLDETTKKNVETIATGQAEYTVSLGSKNDPMSGGWTPNGMAGGYSGDTKAEEMGVYAQSIAPGAAWYPEHANNAAWKQSLSLWSRNMTGLPAADAANPATLDGVPISDNTAHNVWDTFLVENHDSFGPHYQSEVWRTSARNAIHFLLAGQPLPEVLEAQPNGEELLATILGTMSDAGEPLMPMVDDREFLYGRDVLPLAYLAQVQGNPYAARAEQNLAERLLPYQDYGAAPRIAKFSGEPKYEPEARAEVAISYLLHKLRNGSPEGPVAPASNDELFAFASGVVDYGKSRPGLLAQQSPNAWAGTVDRANMVKFVWQPEHDDWLFDISGNTPSMLPQSSLVVKNRFGDVYSLEKDGFDGSASMLDLGAGYAGMTTLPTGSIVYASTGNGSGEGALTVRKLTMPGVPGLDGSRDYDTAEGRYTSVDTTPPAAPTKPANVARLDPVTFPATDARYVRVQGVQPAATNAGYSLFELMVRSGNSAENLASGAKVTASSADPAHPAANLTDGKTDTRWAIDPNAASSVDGWVQADLGSVRSIDSAYLFWDTAAAKQYVVQTSVDGTKWTDVGYKAAIAGVARGDQVNFAPTTTRFLRMQGAATTTAFGYSLFEFEARSGNNGPNLAAAPGVVATASSQDPARPAARVNDSDPASRWAVASADRAKADSWVQLDLGAEVTVDNVRLLWESAMAGAFSVQSSTDGVTWTELAFRAPIVSRMDELSFPTEQARYVRMQGALGNPSFGYSLFEFGVLNGTSPKNLAIGATATASSEDAGSSRQAAKVNDGNFGTRWAVAQTLRTAPDSWIQLDLGAVAPVDRVRLSWESAAGQVYSIQTSVDGTTWKDVAQYSAASGAAQSQGDWLGIEDRVGLVVRDSERPITVVSGTTTDRVILANGASTDLLVEGYATTDAAKTAQLAARAAVKTSDPGLKASDADGYLSVFNLSGGAIDGTITVPAPAAQVSLFDGVQELGADTVSIQRSVAAASSQLLAPRFTVVDVDGTRVQAGVTADVRDGRTLVLSGGEGTVRVTHSASGATKDVQLSGGKPVTVSFAGAAYPLADQAVGVTTFPTSPLPKGMTDPDFATDANPCTAWEPGADGGRMVVDLGSSQALGSVRTVWTDGAVPGVSLSASTDGKTYTEIGAATGERSAVTTVSGSARYVAVTVDKWDSKSSASLQTFGVYAAGTDAAVVEREFALCADDAPEIDLTVAVRGTKPGAPWVDPLATPDASIESTGEVRVRYTITNTGTVPLSLVSPTIDGVSVASCVQDDLAPAASVECEFGIERAEGAAQFTAAVAGDDPWKRVASDELAAAFVITKPAPPTTNPPTIPPTNPPTNPPTTNPPTNPPGTKPPGTKPPGTKPSGPTTGNPNAPRTGGGQPGNSGSRDGGEALAPPSVGTTPTPAATPARPGNIELVIGSARVAAGGTQSATAGGFTPGESIEATLDGIDAPLGRFAADDDGFVTVRFLVPEDLEPGEYTLLVRGAESDRSLTAVFSVVAADEAVGAPAETADEASSIWWWAVPVGAVVLALLVVLTLALMRKFRGPTPLD